MGVVIRMEGQWTLHTSSCIQSIAHVQIVIQIEGHSTQIVGYKVLHMYKLLYRVHIALHNHLISSVDWT